MTDLIGQTIGNYRIEAPLGQGGMGQVYRARHIHLERAAAIKVMHESMASDSDFQARFRQEARAIAALQHPNIVEVYEFGEQTGRYYLALELLNDGSLRHLVRQHAQAGQPWPLSMALDLMRQASDGLAYAHTQGMVHRDIKPDNMLLKRAASTLGGYLLKITDFGLARLAEGGVATHTGTTMGTPAYMSPEQCQGLALDGRSDIYSLGVVLYELSTGYLPFAVKTLSEAVYKHVYEAPTRPRQVRPDVPEALEAIILRCLAKRPEERFATAEELARALAQVLLGQEPLLSRTMIQAAPTPPPSPPPAVGTVVQPQPSQLVPPTAVSLAGTSALPRIQLLDAQGTLLRSLEVGAAGLTIGRIAGNTLVLNDAAISRQHLRVEWDGARVTVTDLGSSNGSLLGTRRLQAQVAELWEWREMLRLGPFWLRLEPPKPAVQPADTPFLQGLLSGGGSTPTVVQQTQISPTLKSRIGSSSSRIVVILDQGQYELVPGQAKPVTVTLVNLGSTVDHLTLTTEGVPGSWVRLPDQALQLAPGMQAEVTLTVTVPRSAESRADEYPVVVRARSRDNPADSGSASTRWIVLPFSESQLAITPRIVDGRTRARYTVRLRNDGNAPAHYTLHGEDDLSALRYSFQQGDSGRPLLLEPGASADVQLLAHTSQRLFGTPQAHNLRIELKGDSQPKIERVQFNQRALLPTWVVSVLIPLLLALCGGIGFGAKSYFIDRPAAATATAVASNLFAIQTATALAQNTAAAANLMTAEAAPAETKEAFLATFTAMAQQSAIAQATNAPSAMVIGQATTPPIADAPTIVPPIVAPIPPTDTPTPTSTPTIAPPPPSHTAPGGVIYAINQNNELLWYHHEGWQDGSVRWTVDHGLVVGSGWDFKQVFSGGDGLIYAINQNNELLWYRHEGWQDGSVRWTANHGLAVGSGWDFKQVFGDR
jgi:serine/threonine protein kinase